MVSRNNLASAYQQANRVPEAITLYEATLAGCERVLGADHPTTRIAQLNLDGARAAMRSKRSWWRYLINRKGKDG
ncbi:tetratricopeptide repeat protein [Streptosporangium lutulentum]